MTSDKIRYSISLSKTMETDLTKSALSIGISKVEAIRRALMLFNYAVKADKIELTIGKEKQYILIK